MVPVLIFGAVMRNEGLLMARMAEVSKGGKDGIPILPNNPAMSRSPGRPTLAARTPDRLNTTSAFSPELEPVRSR